MFTHGISERWLIHIGDITVSFAFLEKSIQILIGSLIAEHQAIGQIITAELAFKNLRSLAVSLYKERHGEDDDFLKLRELMKRAAQAEEKRNQVTHSFWGAGETVDTITRIKVTAKEKSGIHAHFEKTSEADLAAQASDLKLLAGDIVGFWLYLIDQRKAINNALAPFW